MSKIVKKLYKLSRNALFVKVYFCMYCQMLDYNKQWMQQHMKSEHDEHGKLIRMFECKKCSCAMIENEIIYHEH